MRSHCQGLLTDVAARLHTGFLLYLIGIFLYFFWTIVEKSQPRMMRATPLRRPEEDPAPCNLRDGERETCWNKKGCNQEAHFTLLKYSLCWIQNFPKEDNALKQIAKAVYDSYSITFMLQLRNTMFVFTRFNIVIISQFPSVHCHCCCTVF